jgi:hypothetical protein
VIWFVSFLFQLGKNVFLYEQMRTYEKLCLIGIKVLMITKYCILISYLCMRCNHISHWNCWDLILLDIYLSISLIDQSILLMCYSAYDHFFNSFLMTRQRENLGIIPMWNNHGVSRCKQHLVGNIYTCCGSCATEFKNSMTASLQLMIMSNISEVYHTNF